MPLNPAQAQQTPTAQVLRMQPRKGQNASTSRTNWTAGKEDDEKFLPVERLRTQYLDYISAKQLEIDEQKEARRYYHGNQYDAETIRILRARRQPIITYNRMGRKIDGIVGLIERVRQDPKAYPKRPSQENGAEVATATVRCVLDSNDWKTLEADCTRQAGIEGIGGVELKLIEGDQGDPDIALAQVFGDDYFYDFRSYRADFGDIRFEGIAKWIDVDEAVELFPDQEDLLRGLIDNGTDLTTYADREFKWVLTNEKRIRLVEHWYKHKGRWCWAFYVSFNLIDQGESPFRNERGKSMSRFIMFSAAVDHDGDRYGFFRNLKGPQDEINQRRSKGLHISNARRLLLEKGAVDDVEIARREWARADGVVEINTGFGDKVKPDDTQADLAAQFKWLEEAKNEIDGFANVNLAQAAGQGTINNLSGRAINLLQQPGLAELGPFIIAQRGWKLRVYRAVWGLAQQYWTAERWVRVTEDQNIAKFLQINGMDLDEHGRPMLVNALGALDVDIAMDEGPDVVSMMQDTHDTLKTQPPGTVPVAALVETMPIPGSEKRKILGLLKPPPPDPAGEMAKKLALATAAAEIDRTQADTIAKRAKAISDVAGAAEHAHKAALDAAQTYTQGVMTAPIEPPHPEGQGGMPQQGQPPMPPMPPGPMPNGPGPGPMPPRLPMPTGQPPMPTVLPGGLPLPGG